MATFKFIAVACSLGLSPLAFAQYQLPAPPVLPPISQAPAPPIITNPYRPLPPPQLAQPTPIPPTVNPTPGITREVCRGNNPQVCYRIPQGS